MSRRKKRRRQASRAAPRPESHPEASLRPLHWDPTRYALLLAVLVGVAIYRFAVLSDEAAPPGPDPGNWLAFSHELFGASVKAADAVYFPVVPAILKVLQVFFAPLVALKVLGVGASVIMGIPFYLILRRGLSPLSAAGLTLAFLLAGYEVETLSFGGYPQLLATTFLLLAVNWLMDGLISGARRPLLLAAASTALVAGTHHLTLLLMMPTLAVLGVVLLVQERPDLRPALRSVGVYALGTAVFTLPFVPWYVDFLTLMEGNPGNPSGFSALDVDGVTSYVFDESRPLWIVLTIFAAVVSLVPRLGERAARIRPAAMAVLAGPMLVFAITSEIRTFQLIEAGIILSLGVAVAAVEQHLSQTQAEVTFRRLEQLTLGLAMALLLFLIAGSGHDRLADARGRYQILEGSAIEALDWLRRETPPDARVLANDSVSRVSYAWWVEGYARRATYSLIEPEFLAFAEEREQSRLATRLLEEDTSASEVQAILEETGIEYAFLDKRNGARFEPLLSKQPFDLLFENEDYAVLRFLMVEAQREP